MRNLALTALLLGSGSVAFGFGTIGPFVGSVDEDFESFNTYNINPYSSGTFFSGLATFTSTTNGDVLWVIDDGTNAGWGLGGNGSAQIHGGLQAGGLFNNDNTQALEIVFSTPVSRFGGYFATVDEAFPDAPLRFEFYDTSNSLIGTFLMYTTSSDYVWAGWDHAPGISRIVMMNNLAPVMDDLQTDLVPEPASMTALGLGLLALLRKRRKA